MKNLFFYGFFGTSSWAGMSLWIKANGHSSEDLEIIYSKGIISSLAIQANLKPFQPIDNYFDDINLSQVPCHHPADCNVWRTTGKPNFNHSGYVYLSSQLWKDALKLISYNTSIFTLYTAGAYCLMLWHSSDSVHTLFKENMEVVEDLEKIYRFLYFGFIGIHSKHADPGIWIRTILITVFFLLLYFSTLANLLRKNTVVTPGIATLCLFSLLIHCYTLSISNLIEFGENNRFRFCVGAAFLVLLSGNIVMGYNTRKHRISLKKRLVR